MAWLKAAAAAVAAVLSLGAAAPDASEVGYTVSPEMNAAGLAALDVTVRLRADASGVTRLELPDRSAGASDLWRYLQDIRVDGAASVDEDGPAFRVVRSVPSAPLTVRYRVVSAFDRDPDANTQETYKPAIRPRWFWVYGEALFLRPQGDGHVARFAWRGAPRGFPFASDLEHAGAKPMAMDDLFQSVLVGGPDLKLFKRAAGGPLRIAVIGQYPFTDETFANTVTRIVAGERAFWRATEGPFLVVLAPLKPTLGRRSTRGEGRGDAFAIMTTPDVSETVLKATLAHEYFHTWDPRRLGRMYEGDHERAAYWFSEGFTDFYAWRLLLRSGEYDLKTFAGTWNDMLLAYANSPVREAPGSRIVQDFWKDRSVEKLPYQRGAIMAARWEGELRNRSHGRVDLDDVMRAMQVRAKALGPASPKAPDLFVETARGFGLEVGPEVEAVMKDGAPALLPKDAFGACLPVTTVTIPAFDYGFDIDATYRTNTVTGVRRDSAAFAAGLRDGMTYVHRESGRPGDSRQLLVLRVKADGAERLISYSAAGKSLITLQQIAVPPDLTPAQRTTCAVEAGGLAPTPGAAGSR